MYYGEYVPTINYAVMGEKNSAASAYAKKYEIKFLTQDNLKVSSVKAQKVKNNKIKVSWKRNTTVSGYQIQYSTDSKFKKKVKTSVTSKKTVRIKGKGYIRIRAFRVDSMKTKCYGKFSKIIRISKNK